MKFFLLATTLFFLSSTIQSSEHENSTCTSLGQCVTWPVRCPISAIGLACASCMLCTCPDSCLPEETKKELRRKQGNACIQLQPCYTEELPTN